MKTGNHDSVVSKNNDFDNFNYKQIDEASVDAQLEELFDKSIDENDNEHQESSLIPFLVDDKTKNEQEDLKEKNELPKKIYVPQSTINDIKKLFNFDSLLFFKK
jgi:hypothetical protein